MNEHTRETGGWLDSLRRTGDSLLGLAQSRFELFAVELQEEKCRLALPHVLVANAGSLGTNFRHGQPLDDGLAQA